MSTSTLEQTEQMNTQATQREVRLDPVFVVGYKRSGTTVFRLMLNAHDQLFIPTESEYIQRAPKMMGKGVFQKEDIDGLLERLPHGSFDLFMDREMMRPYLESALPGDLSVVIAALYQACAEQLEKQGARWGDKKPQHWQFIDGLTKWYPDAQFIHICRDPRDVIASIEQHLSEQVHGRGWLPAHVISAWHWDHVIRQMQRQSHRLPETRFTQVRYEDLMADTEGELRRLCGFLNLPFLDQMTKFQEQAKDERVQGSHEHGDLHVNTAKEVTTNRIGRYQASFTASQVADIEAVATKGMEIKGYVPSAKPVGPVRRLYLKTLCMTFSGAWACIRLFRRLRGSL
ncbi:MAG: sulfotransferase [Phycisphaeraceae bacterium]|nr:sulfotransferase [Phycisphaeraceae bacterium]